MKGLCYRTLSRERSLRRAFLLKAQGVPAFGVRRVRLVEAWRTSVGVIGYSFILLWVMGLLNTAGSFEILENDYIATFLALSIAGFLINLLGSALLFPSGGLTLASTPVSNSRVLTLALTRISFWSFLSGLALFFLIRISQSEVIISALFGAMCLPVLGLSWQAWLQGRLRGGIFFIFAGICGILAVLIFQFLEDWMSISTVLPHLSRFESWLPINWGQTSLGCIFLVAVYAGFIISFARLWRGYSFRRTPGAEVGGVNNLSASVDWLEVKAQRAQNESTSVESLPSRVEEELGSYSKLSSLLWNEKEMMIARCLGSGKGSAVGLKYLLTVFLLESVSLPYLMTGLLAPEISIGLVFGGAASVAIFLVRGFKSDVVAITFASFRLPNSLLQSVLVTVPVRERLLFRMFLKEAMAVLLFTLPLQLFALWILAKAGDFQILFFHVIIVSVYLVAQYFTLKLASWNRFLWESLSLFQPGLRGEILLTLCKLLFVVPSAIFFVLTIWSLAYLLGGEGSVSWFFLYQFLQTSWIVGFCWWIRRAYRLGLGSAVVAVKKKKQSFRLS